MSSPLPTGLDRPAARRVFFIDELDLASGARGDWRRDPDGNDGDAGAVRRKPHYFTALP